ncbi:NAD(P)-dependent oxidoreductase [Vibrio sp. 10N.261.55.A7]|uniref:NAD(P)-dependent oxidoreductase n=1 Tax=Vibrio sp. 10N.261.55.A7 TaxID=1880851 RepID=UPI000C8228A2|nr:NAD(P)-dependent oxidoreductase [Vibrio sp. 10N.261.55.A7]PMK04954.1 NAD-dependent dehydratase [Vibrio sp. 10N.261.55.A7]
MKVAVLGASGWIGSHVANEAKSRGHQVSALVRDPSKIDDPDVNVFTVDLNKNINDLVSALTDVDVLIASVGGRAAGNHEIVKNTAETLLEVLPKTKVERLLWVGGAGSLEVAPGVKLVTVPEFPEEYKAEALAQGEALEVFKQSDSPLNWTFVSPAAEIFPGEKLGRYRVGQDELISDDSGASRISVSDYAVAMIDELESANNVKKRIGVAY